MNTTLTPDETFILGLALDEWLTQNQPDTTDDDVAQERYDATAALRDRLSHLHNLSANHPRAVGQPDYVLIRLCRRRSPPLKRHRSHHHRQQHHRGAHGQRHAGLTVLELDAHAVTSLKRSSALWLAVSITACTA